MNLYEINAQIAEFIEKNIDSETGEISNLELLSELEMQKESKIENIALFYKNCLADAEMLKNEISALTNRKKSAEKKAESLKKYLKFALQDEKFNTPKVSVNYRKSTNIQITDFSKIDKSFLKFAEPTPDKNAIKNAIKNGEIVEGAELIETTNINIK